MRSLVLSVDYEIFGNGTGDVRQHVTIPTERMTRLCEKYNIPLTIFLETEEYFSFIQNAGQLKADLGCDPAQLIREQMVELIRRGHDVQLHLHPEWYGARYEQGKWVLRPEKQTVDALFETEEETSIYIGSRKQLLRELLQEAESQRDVVAYRAGAFSAQPSVKLLGALAANGISLDSSVVKGLTRRNGIVSMDYRNAPSAKNPWRVGTDVAKEDSQGAIWELPIYSVTQRRFQQATWTRLRAKFSKNVPKNRQRQMVQQLGMGKNPVSVLKFLFQPVPIKLDYHNLSPETLLHWIKSAPPPQAGLPDLVMLIGHTKEHINDEAFDAFLQLVSRDPELKIVSLSDAVGMLPPMNQRPTSAQAFPSSTAK